MAQKMYCEALIAVASIFDKSGDSSLIALLAGNNSDNPIVRWGRDLKKAQSLIDNNKLTDAIILLNDVLLYTDKLTGSGVDEYLPKTFGCLGVAHFRAG